MSLIICMKIPGAIIAASDCRVTGTVTTQETKDNVSKDASDRSSITIINTNNNYIKTDQEQKTFLLVNRFNKAFSISYCGNASVDEFPTSFCISKALKILKDVKSTYEIAEYFKFLWKETNNRPSLLISGYNGKTASILELRSNGVEIISHYIEDNDYGFVCDGEQKFIKCLLDNFNFEYKYFRLQDAIVFCEFLISTTAKVQEFQSIQQTVSSKYDLLVITENKSKWIVKNSNKLI